MNLNQTLFTSLFFILITLFSCRKENIKGTSRTDDSVFTIEEQKIIGDEISKGIHANTSAFPLLDSSASANFKNALNYLQDTVLNIITNSPALTVSNDFEWKANIINLPEKHHAFFLPNGEFFIHVDLLKLLKDDSELIGVIAHELAYVEKNWVMKNLKDEFGAAALNELGKGDNSSQLKEIAEHFNNIQYNSSETLFADSFAISAICPFSYDPGGLKTTIIRLRGIPSPKSIDWYNRRVADFKDREQTIDSFFDENLDCRSGRNEKRETEYLRFKSYLQ